MENAIFQQAIVMAQQMAPENLALSVIFSHRREILLTEANAVLAAQMNQRDQQLGAARLNQANAEQAQRNSENALRVANRDLAELRQENDLLTRHGRQKIEECIRAETRQQVAEEGIEDLENSLWDANLEIATQKGHITAKDEKIAEAQRKYDQERQAHQQTRETLTREHHAAEQVDEQLAAEPTEPKQRVRGLAMPRTKRRRVKEKYRNTKKLQLAFDKALLCGTRRCKIRSKSGKRSSVQSTTKTKTAVLKPRVSTPDSQPQTKRPRASSYPTRSTASTFRCSPTSYPKAS